MRLRHLLCLTAAVASLAGAVQAQTATPLTVKDGSGASQPLGEYKPDGTNLAGWTVKWVWTGSAWVLEPADGAGHPVVAGPCTQVVAVNQTASSDVYASTNKVHVCALVIFSQAQQAVSVVEGTGATCGTGTAALIGATTAVWNSSTPTSSTGLQFFAGQGISQTSGVPFLQSKTAGDHICILQGIPTSGGTASVVSGFISFGDY